MYQNIIAEMARNNLTREKLASQMNMNLTSFRKSIRGDRSWKIDEIDYLLSLFGTTYEYLFKKF
jgi:hypothetical protein